MYSKTSWFVCCSKGAQHSHQFVVERFIAKVCGYSKMMNGHARVSKRSIREKGPSPYEVCAFEGHVEVSTSDGPGIRDLRWDMLGIELMRSDRTQPPTPEGESLRRAHSDVRPLLCYCTCAECSCCEGVHPSDVGS